MAQTHTDIAKLLSSLAQEKEALKERLEEITEAEGALNKLLKSRIGWSFAQENLFAQPDNGASEENEGERIKKFLLSVLAEGEGWSLAELKQASIDRNFNVKSNSLGRSLHIVLVLMKGQQLVERLDSGKWRAVK